MPSERGPGLPPELAEAWQTMWADAARALGAGQITRTRLVARLDGALVWVAGGPPLTVRAAAVAGDRVDLRLEAGHVYPIARALGVQDLVVGDQAFDERFVVKASDEALARAWLDPLVRRRALATDRFVFTVRRGQVIARLPGTTWPLVIDQLAPAIVAAAHTVAALATAAHRIGDGWRALAASLGGRAQPPDAPWAPGGELAIVVPTGEGEVRIDAVIARPDARRFRRRVHTRALARRTAATPDRWALVRDGADVRPDGLRRCRELAPAGWQAFAEAPEALAARLGSGPFADLALAAPVAVIADGEHVTGWLPGVLGADEQRRAQALVALVARLAFEVARPSGPYR